MTGTAINSAQTIAPSPRTSGSVLYAPVGTALPTSSYAALNSAFTDLGYIDENGLKQKEERSNTDVYVWSGSLLGTLQDKYGRTMTFKLMQFLNENVLAAGYGHNNVTVTYPTGSQGKEVAVALNANLLDTLSWVFDGYYYTPAGAQALIRVVVPKGRITQLGDVDVTNKAFTSVEATMKAFPDTSGNHAYLYVNDGLTTGFASGS